MRLGRFTALAGGVPPLSLMSVISVVIGRAFQSIPSGFNDSLPLEEHLAVGLLFFFGADPARKRRTRRTDRAAARGERRSLPEIGRLNEKGGRR